VTATLDPAGVLVPLEDVRRHLGYPRADVAALLGSDAATHGLPLDVRDDWAGRPCVPEVQARQLVDAVTAARGQALVDKRRRNRAAEEASSAAEQRCEQRARLCYRLAVEQFGDESVAVKLAHQAARQDVADGDLAREFEAAGVRWEQGFRTLAPEPGRGDESAREVKDRLELRHTARRAIQVRLEHEKRLRRLREGRGR
jgi:hypothetical protein